jgi:type II secretory pathway predicted ATPase ExeA
VFLDFYGLKDQPFGVTPDPRFLYMSPSHREALASLYCAIENNRGFSAMVAPPGMGKTSLLFRLLESVKGKARTAFLFHPDIDAPQFLQSLLLDIGLDGSGHDFVKMRDSLNRMLIEERRAGRRFVLVVDEAQNLSSEILESIRLLSNFETPREKLLHIVLAGQPRLSETLRQPEMSQLSQRVSTLIGLQPFSREEIFEYIRYRLSVAGRNNRSPFSEEALNVIAQASGGIPRNINSLCYQALAIGCALRKATIDGDVLNELTRDLQNTNERTIFTAKTGEHIAVDWRHSPLRQELPIWTKYPEKRSGRWKLPMAVLATAALSGVFWTTALPKLKMYQDLSRLTPPPLTPTITPTSTQQVAEEPLSNPLTPPSGENSNEEITGDPDNLTSPSGDIKTGKKLVVKTKKNSHKTVSIRQVKQAQTKPRVVFADKQKSLYQLALENYGESNSLIVDSILVENPALQNRYAIVAEGQRIVLPNLPETALKNGTTKRN